VFFAVFSLPVPIYREATNDRPNNIIVISTEASRFLPVVERPPASGRPARTGGEKSI